VTQRPAPLEHARRVEITAFAGVAQRPSTSSRIHYDVGYTAGGQARIAPVWWLAFRLYAGIESNNVSFSQGALGLPSGTQYQLDSFQRVRFGITVEPTWHFDERLEVWLGAGIGWGRTIASPLTTTGAVSLTVPAHAAVFVELPFTLGARWELVPDWLVVSLSGNVIALTDQSGTLLEAYSTPNGVGKLVTIPGFPELGTSWVVLAGLGVLL
jgi:hypothetical protein